MTVASTSTVQRWYRQLKKGTLSKPAARVGRPRTSDEIEKLVVRMATENPTWGYLRIVGELKRNGITLARNTVAEILKRHGIEPIDPQRRTRESTWKQFLAEHNTEIAATDFFTIDVWSWLGWFIGKRTIYVLFAIHLATRKVEILGTTDHPTEEFMNQVARNATMDDVGWFKRMGVRYLIQDRDTKFCDNFRGVLERAGIESIRTPARSPNLNAYAERWVRTVKQECLRRLTILGYGALNRALKEFLEHYHHHRPHQSLGNSPPESHIRKPEHGENAGRIRCVESCEGVLRHYCRSAACLSTDFPSFNSERRVSGQYVPDSDVSGLQTMA